MNAQPESLIISQPDHTPQVSAGVYTGKLTDIKDLGLVKGGQYGDKEKLELSWTVRENGKEQCVAQRCTKSLSSLAKLTEVIEAITGDGPGSSFDVMTLVGKRATLVIVHSDDGQWANIKTVLPFKNAHGVAVTDEDIPF